MAITLNGTSGVVTPGATVGSITGILKATSGVVAQAIAGSDYGQLTLATVQTAFGTAVDFTGIPSWAKKVSVILNSVSLNGSSLPRIQLGTGGIPSTTGYSTQSSSIGSVTVGTISSSNGFDLYSNSPIYNLCGIITFIQISSNLWIGSGVFSFENVTGTLTIAGNVTLIGILNMVRITSVNGTDTFDAGTINISYE